jgi:hypothetical protein
LALAEDDWSVSHPGRITPGERSPLYSLLGGWLDPRAGLDDIEKRKFLTVSGIEIRYIDYAIRLPTQNMPDIPTAPSEDTLKILHKQKEQLHERTGKYSDMQN